MFTVLITCSTAILFVWLHIVRGSNVVGSQETASAIRQAKSEEMLKYLNTTADPCDDFYHFACGNWPTINPATKTKYETNVFQTTKEELGRKILTLLVNANDANDSKIFGNVKNYYKSCLSATTVADIYKDKLRDMVKEFGQMPALEGDKWPEADFDWLKTVADIAHKYDINIILGYQIKVDLENNTVNRVYISHPNFPLKSLPMYLDKANQVYRQNYQQVIAGNLKEFLSLESDLAQQIATEILDFEISLVRGTERYTVRGKELNFATTVEKLHTLHRPDLDIKRLLEISLGSLPTGRIIVKNPGYQTRLIEVLRNTPKKLVANYIFYNLMVHFLLPINKAPWVMEAKCMEKTKGNFANVLDHMVYRKFNTNQTEKAVQRMFQDLKANFQIALESGKYNWIDETTRKLAVEKLGAMKLEINSYENFNFTEEYGDLALGSSDYIENVKAIFALNARKTRAKLDEPPKSYYDGAAMSFGPRYILTENTIKIPVATLQPYHFWSDSYPHAVNFGRLGFLLAHEMIHGFDDEGRTFDKLGNDRDWWDANSAQVFADRITCFRDQYKHFAYEGLRPMHKSPQQSENIADNGGVRLTYEAFTTWHNNALKSQRDMHMETLSDFNYSGKQLFFISFAQLWCYDILPDVRGLKLATDVHEPGNLRVIGSLSNFDEFSNAFNCPRGSGMNPSNKCEIF